MRIGVTGICATAVLLAAVASAKAQVPLPPGPAPGFVSTYEIVRTLRSAGFDPLAPPLREGGVYVARATDYRGILMRVVLDARTGAIRDANRIVPGPGDYGGPYGSMDGVRAYAPYGPSRAYGPSSAPGPYASGPYASGPYASGPYDPDPDDAEDAAPYGSGPYGPAGTARLPYGLPPDAAAPAAPPVMPRPAAGPSVTPLPRPRPPELASRKSTDDAKPAATAAVAKPSAAADSKPDVKPDPKPAVTAATPAAPSTPAAQTSPPPAAPANPGKAPSTLTINN